MMPVNVLNFERSLRCTESSAIASHIHALPHVRVATGTGNQQEQRRRPFQSQDSGYSQLLHVTGSKQARGFHTACASIQASETGQEWPYLRPLLLAFFASQQRSAFAARSLVQTAIELFQQGTAWSDIQLELKLAGIREGEQIEMLDPQEQKKARLLVNLEKDVLLQWIGLIFMTLDELHVEKASSGKGPLQDSSQMVKGMRGFVRHTLSLGFDSQRLQLQQQIALDEKGEALPSVKLMQENARLVVLTKEIADQLRKRTPEASENSESKDDDQLRAPQSSQGTTPDESPQSSAPAEASARRPVDQSSVLVGSSLEQQAARILLGFLGAVQGSRYSVNAFLEELLSAYLVGWAAHEIYSTLSVEDFLCGKSMFPIAAINGSAQINADIFGHWVSTVYITLAQIGVPHKAQKDSVGWAWASPLKDADAVAANRLSHLVSITLQSEAQEEGQPPVADSEALAAVKALPRTSKLPKKGHDFAVLEDPRLSESSSAMGLMSQLLNLVTLTGSLAARTKRTEGIRKQ